MSISIVMTGRKSFRTCHVGAVLVTFSMATSTTTAKMHRFNHSQSNILLCVYCMPLQMIKLTIDLVSGRPAVTHACPIDFPYKYQSTFVAFDTTHFATHSLTERVNVNYFEEFRHEHMVDCLLEFITNKSLRRIDSHPQAIRKRAERCKR